MRGREWRNEGEESGRGRKGRQSQLLHALYLTSNFPHQSQCDLSSLVFELIHSGSAQQSAGKVQHFPYKAKLFAQPLHFSFECHYSELYQSTLTTTETTKVGSSYYTTQVPTGERLPCFLRHDQLLSSV